ncbi:MAG: site-specific integrase, partial [Candidatus Latescibacteria bacterium]|nr:site-specific integrase [Candidatus Latescibacterota bacterium]
SKITFRAFKDIWLEKYAIGQVRRSTEDNYQSYLQVHLLPAFGDTPLARISVEDVQGFKAKKLADDYSPQTVKHLLRLLRQMLSHAVEWGYIRTNPAQKVKDPRVPKFEMDFLSPKEIRHLLGTVESKWHPFFLTAITTGLRQGELLAMKWANLDWKSSRYFVRESLLQIGVFAAPKTEGSAQSVDLTPACVEALQAHRKRQAAEKLEVGASYQDHDLVFATALGTALDAHNVVKRVFHPSLAKAELRRIRFHDLRHTCATLLINEGISPKYIQRQLRHTSIETTFDRYGHLFPETNQDAIRKLDAVLANA